MNLDDLCSKSYLLSIIDDEEKLDEAVTNSRGFVLYVMEREGLFPKLNLLMNKENVFSFNFILKNYELSKSENKKLRKYFSDNADNQIINEKLSQEEIEEFLTSNQELYHNTILNIQTIKKYVNEIELAKQDDSYKIEGILKKSLKILTIKEILSLGDDFLSKNIEQLTPYFQEKQVKNKYRELKEKEAENNYSLILRDFRAYPFEAEDKEFLHQLIKESTKDDDDYKLTYEEFSELKGVKELITPIEFFQLYNSENITSLTTEEIKENIEIIRMGFLNKIVEKEYYDPLAKFVKGIKNVDNIKLILTQEFFDVIVKNIKNDFFNNIGSLNQENQKINDYIGHLKMEYIINNQNNKEILSKFNLESLLEEVNFIIDDKIENENYKKLFIEILPKKLATEEFFSMLNNRNKDYVSLESLKIFEIVVDNSPSINLLALLLQIDNKISYKKYKIVSKKDKEQDSNKILNKILNKLIQKLQILDSSSVESLTNYYNYNISSLIQLKKGLNVLKINKSQSNTISSIENQSNFLQYEKNKINDLSEEYINLLLAVKKDFYKELLESNYQLSEDHYILLLNEIDKSHIKKFLIEYSLKNKVEIENNAEIKKALIRNPLGKEIINIEDKNLQENNFKEWLINIAAQNDITSQINNIKINEDEYYDYDNLSKEEKKLRQKRKELSEQIDIFIIKNRDLESSFPKEFIEEKLITMLNQEMYSTILTAVNKNSLVIDETIVVAHIKKMDFNTVLKNIETEDFRKLLFNFATYASSEEKIIKFGIFNDKENTILAELLLPYSSNDKAFLSLFQEKSYSFMKDFLIRKMPKQLLNTYNLREEYIKEKLSPLEIIQLFKNIEKEHSIFIGTERNHSHRDFFNKNFKENKIAYLETLELAKKDFPKLYTLLINNNILTNFIFDERRKASKKENNIIMSADEEACVFLDKELNIDTIIKGMKEIAQDISNDKSEYHSENRLNKEEALLAIEKIIYLSSYEKEANINGKHERYYESHLSEKSSDKLMKALWEINPSLILQFNCIGSKVRFLESESLKENLKECLIHKNYSMIDLLYPKTGFQNNNTFNIRNGYEEKTWFQKTIDNYINGLIDYYNDNNKANELFYMSFLSQQHDFLHKELKGYYKYPGNPEIMNYITNDEELNNKINKVSQKLFLENTLVGKTTIIKKSNKL